MSSFDKTPDHLLRTKLYPPRVPLRVVRRQELLDRLEQRRDRPVTLISAPAGYGKSTLISQWLQASEEPYGWLSLDEYDTGLDTVLTYIIAALQTAVPDFAQETNILLGLPQLPAPEKVADTLLVDLQRLEEPQYLVLDDYHSVVDPAIHLFMMRLLQRLPQSMRVIIISRADPPLSLAQLRGRGQLREIRGGDLRFSRKEAAELIEQIVGQPVGEETVRTIVKLTEGWPVGLRMAAMSLRAAADPDEFTRRYAEGGQKLVTDYLLEEVLEQLPPNQRLLLLRTAVVDRFCAPLIDVLAEQSLPDSSGYDFLESLWASNFFLIALDVQGTWYRYHHLFRQLLQQQLQKVYEADAVDALHLKAGQWFEEAGYIEDAIIHAVKAGEPQTAAKLVERHVHDAVNQEEWRRVERWVNLLPEEARGRPGILAVQVMLEQFRYRMATIVPLLDVAEKGLKSGAYDYSPAQQEAWQGVLNTYRATNMLPLSSPRDSLHYAHQAMQQVDPDALYVRSIAELWYIYALQQSGEPQQAIRLARQKLAGQTGQPDVRTNRMMLAQCAIFHAEADVPNLRNVARSYLELAARTEHQVSIAWANYFLGWCGYQENKLDGAQRHFSRAVEMRYLAHMRSAVDCITGLALILHANGQPAEVKSMLQILRDFIMEQGTVAILPLADSLALRLDSHGTRSGSIHCDTVGVAQQLASDLWELPILTASKVAIESGEPQQLAAAEITLASCFQYARSRNAVRQLLRIGILQASLFEARGDHELALERLRETVLLGESGGAVRYFVDEGPGLLPLLQELHEAGVANPYIEGILMAYPESIALTGSGDGQEPRALSATAVALMSEITNREMEVLLLLAERLTNKEIAARLHISPRTVKKHSINLYQKLEVENRRQAVARALEVGIING